MATKFITVSVEILRDTNLTSNEKFILAEIEQLTQLDRGCIASNQHFADLLQITKQSASRTINNLETKGYIESEIKIGTRNRVRIIKMLTRINKMNKTYQQNDDTVSTNCLESKENIQVNIQESNEHSSFSSSVFSNKEIKSIVDYRKSIKSSLKSQQGYKGLENKLISVMKEFNFTLVQALKIMADNEWKSIEVDWVKNKGIKPVQAKKLGGVL